MAKILLFLISCVAMTDSPNNLKEKPKESPKMDLPLDPELTEAQQLTEGKKRKTNENDRLYQKDFQYHHRNPYHEKLTEFDEFVMRDSETETHLGNWNKEVFKREAPLCVEIGSGYGHFMLDYCENNPDVNFVGMDLRFKRTYNLAKRLAKFSFKSFRYLRARGERIEFMFEENEADRIFYFFPDPWPKKRHHKKRLFQMPFLQAAYKVLRPGGTLYVKTDHTHYAEWMIEHMDKPEALELFDIKLKTRDLYKEAPDHYLASFQTKFEKIFLKKEQPINAFELVSKKEK